MSVRFFDCQLVQVKHKWSSVLRVFECLATSQVHPIINLTHGNHEPILSYKIDIILSSFSFSKPIESLQTYISIDSLRHQRASYESLIKRLQHFNATSYNIVAWCCDMCWTGWPNARNIFNATCGCLCDPGPWYATSGPSTHALVQQCCVNVAKQVQHHTTCKMLSEKFDRYEIWSNSIQHVATYRNRVAKRMQHVVPNNVARCCAEMWQVFGQVFSEHADDVIKLLAWNCLTLFAMVQL